MDFQGDLMIWCPELNPRLAGIRPGAAGIDNGWVWTIYLPWYPADQRQILYDRIRSYGFTHVALHVGQAHADGGYHDMRPTTQAEADSYGQRLNDVHRELVANGLIPICAGVAPDAPVSPGFDTSQVLIAMTDWDNTNRAFERIKAIGDTFERALLYYERPGPQDRVFPEPSGEPVAPNDGNGGQWIAAVQKLYPNFVGMLYEVNGWDGVDACVAEINRTSTWWRDLQLVLFELYTYQQYWENVPFDHVRSIADQILARCPQLKGNLAGATTHPMIADAPPAQHSGGEAGKDEVDINEVRFVGGVDVRPFPKDAALTKLILGLTDISVDFTKKDGPGRWPDVTPPGWAGTLQYSMGLGFKVDGQWYASAPVEAWHGKPGAGGPIMSQATINGFPGQIPANWFYDGRWHPLTGRRVAPGTELIFFVVAGDYRNGAFAIQARSNIVRITQPAEGESAVYEWTT